MNRYIHKNMVARCTYPRFKQYADYGGRGIKVCDEWLGTGGRERFEAYVLATIGPPLPGYSLDRINNDGDYEPGNIRWATRAEQQRNQRMNKRNTTGFTGVYRRKGKFFAKVAYDRVQKMIGTFATPEEAAEARRHYLEGLNDLAG